MGLYAVMLCVILPCSDYEAMLVAKGECGKVNCKQISESYGCEGGISVKALAEVLECLLRSC